MALLNFGGRDSGGLFGGLLEFGGGPGGYERLTPEAEAQLAQEARDAAANRNPVRRGADMALYNTVAAPESLTQQIIRLGMPASSAGFSPMPPPAAQSAPAFMPGGMDAGISVPIQAPQQNPIGQPLSLAPPNLGARPSPALPQPQAPPQAMPSPATPDFGDRFGASIQSLFNSPSLISGIGNAMQSLQTGQRTDPTAQAQANQTQTAKAIFDGLVSGGHSPQQAYGIALAAAGNPEIAKAILPQALGPKEPPKTMEEYLARKAYENDRRPGGAQGGAPNATQGYLDYLSAKKSAETLGEKRGANLATLPSALQNSDMTVKHIDELLMHPGFDRLFGVTGMFPSLPGGQAAGADARMKQVTGEAFLSGFDMLRGGGAITEMEGKKATEAKARFDRAQSPEEARVALKDFRDAVVQGRVKLQEQAGVTPTPMPNQPAQRSTIAPPPGFKIVGQ